MDDCKRRPVILENNRRIIAVSNIKEATLFHNSTKDPIGVYPSHLASLAVINTPALFGENSNNFLNV